MSRPIAVYKSTLLPKSETFLRTQAESLSRYRVHYLGLINAHGLVLPADRSYLLGDEGRLGRAKVIAFKLTGRSPELTRQMRARRIELVHAHFGTEAWRAMQLSQPLGLPTVVTFHGADATTSDDVLRRTSSSGRQYVRHRNQIFSSAARCIAVSEYIAQRLISSGCPPERIVVHRIGVDSEWFRPTEPSLHERGLLFVGRLVEKKGLLKLFDAMEVMQRQNGDGPTLTIAGDGPQRCELEEAARRLRIRVTFLGHQDHASVRALMHSMTALVVPSHDASSGESEGLPTVIREAQASGLPVVVTRTAGAPEAVTDNVDGLLVPPRDPMALAGALTQLLGDVKLQEALRSNGLRAAAAADVAVQARSLEALYDEVRTEQPC
jgi:colanic acid/amylovoran biosynthesis glycosyltransferase